MLAEGPSSLVQIPVPGEGLFPSIVILVVPEGIQMPDPAFATIGPTVLTTSTVMLLAVDPQPLAIVHVKVYKVEGLRPVTTALAECISEKLTSSEGLTDHVPLSKM